MDDHLECVGDDIDRLRSDVPVDVVTEFDVGSALGCGLRLDATPACWGSSLNSFNPPQVPMHEVVGCGIRVNGSVACWGDNSSWLNSQTRRSMSKRFD